MALELLFAIVVLVGGLWYKHLPEAGTKNMDK